MNFLRELLSNHIFVSAAMGWFIAQLLKTLIYAYLNHGFNLERMYGSGGMPSSHSATVTALATASYFELGAASPAFAISVILAIIVMYDARGVRRETGKQAEVLNYLMTLITNQDDETPAYEKLKEFVGHTPLQVAIGAILGILVAVIMQNFY